MIRFITYEAVDPVPAGLRFVAYPVDDKGGKIEILPLRFFGETAESAKAEAERLVDSERKKLQRDDGVAKQATPTQLAALEKARAARIAKRQAGVTIIEAPGSGGMSTVPLAIAAEIAGVEVEL